MPRIVQTSKAVRQTAEQNKSPVLSYKTPRVRVEHTQKSYARYKMQHGQYLRIKTPHSPTCGSQACGYDPQTPSGRVTSKIGRESQIEPWWPWAAPSNYVQAPKPYSIYKFVGRQSQSLGIVSHTQDSVKAPPSLVRKHLKRTKTQPVQYVPIWRTQEGSSKCTEQPKDLPTYERTIIDTTLSSTEPTTKDRKTGTTSTQIHVKIYLTIRHCPSANRYASPCM